MVRRAQIKNVSRTTLSAPLAHATTSATVVDGSVFPSEGDFLIAIGNELAKVTARSTNTLTIVRGIEGSGSDTYETGKAVFLVGTAESFNDFHSESSIDNVYPDYAHKFIDSVTTLTSSDFSWTNQGTATAIDETSGGITLKTPTTGTVNNLRLFERAEPAGGWTITVHTQLGHNGYNTTNSNNSCGLSLRDNASGKLAILQVRPYDVIANNHFTGTSNAFDTTPNSIPWRGSDKTWLQIEYDGVDTYTMLCSFDGVNWFTVSTETEGAYLTPTHVGILGINEQSADCFHHYTAWIEE